MLKRLVLLAACALFPCWLSATSISGSLRDLGMQNANSGNARVEFNLQNYGSNIPKVSGTGIVFNPKYAFLPDSNGDISGTVYGNDVITPAGTYYRICIFYEGRQFRCSDYDITGTGFDLDSASPKSLYPTQTQPTQVVKGFTHVQTTSSSTWTIVHGLDDRNVITQCFNSSFVVTEPSSITNTDSNTVTVTWGSPQTGRCTIHSFGALAYTLANDALLKNPTSDQTITGYRLFPNRVTVAEANNIRFAVAFTGADAGAKIIACIADLPTTGGVCDARGLEGTQIWSSNIFSGITKPIKLELGDSTITVNTSQITLPSNSELVGAGMGRTIIKHGASQALPATDFIKSVASASNVTVRDLTIDGQASSQTPTTEVSLIELANTTDVRLERVEFLNAIDSGVFGYGVVGLDILHSKFSNWKSGNFGAIHIDNRDAATSRASSKIRIAHNKIDGSVSNSTGVKLSGQTTYNITQSDTSNNFVIVGDHATEGTLGIELYSATGQGMKRSVVSNNIVVGENNTNSLIYGISIAGNGVSESTITGNVIYDCRLYGLELAASTNLAATGNTVVNSGTPLSTSPGITLNEVSNSTVTGNTISGYKYGVYFYSQEFQTTDASNNVVSSNIINLPAAYAGARGIFIQSNSASASIVGNTISSNIIIGDQTASTHGISFQRDSGTIDRTSITSNTIRGVAVGINCSTETNDQVLGNQYFDTPTITGGTFPATSTRVEFNPGGTEYRIDPAGDTKITSQGTNKSTYIWPSGTGRFEVRTDGDASTNGRVYFYGTAAQGADVGMGINIGGKYTDAGDLVQFAQITANKDDSTTGNYGGYLKFSTRPNAGSFTERLRIKSSGEVMVSNGGLVINAVTAPTVTSGQVGFGSTTAATATNGAGEAMKANVEGYLTINIGGTAYKIPYVKN